MDESSGVRADSYGNNDLTDNNTVGTAECVTGNYGADFERANTEYLSISDASQTGLDLTSTGDFSLSQWIKFESIDDSNAQPQFVKWQNSGDQRSYFISLSVTSGNDYGVFYGSTNGTDPSAWGGGTGVIGSGVSIGSCYHFVWTHKGGESHYKLWINGTYVTKLTSASAIYNGTAPVQIGGDQIGGYLDGVIDEVTIWSTELSTSSISTLYNGGVPLSYDTPAPEEGIKLIGLASAMFTQTNCTLTATSASCSHSVPTTTPQYNYDPSSVIFSALIVFFISFFGLIYYFKRHV